MGEILGTLLGQRKNQSSEACEELAFVNIIILILKGISVYIEGAIASKRVWDPRYYYKIYVPIS